MPQGEAQPMWRQTRYERTRKLIKWSVFTGLLSVVALIAGKSWHPSVGETYFAAVGIVAAGYGEMLFDRRHTAVAHGGRADYTYIMHSIACIALGGLAVFRYGEVTGSGVAEEPLDVDSAFIIAGALIAGGAAAYFSESSPTKLNGDA